MTVRVAVPVAPFESLAVSVMVCVPAESAVVETLAPVPIWPLMLLVQTSDAPDSAPSSTSLPAPVNVTLAPCAYEAPLAGAEMVAVGALFAAAVPIVIVTDAWPVRPQELRAVSVNVCVPSGSADVEMLSPVIV